MGMNVVDLGKEVKLTYEELGDQQFLKISNSDQMRPFFMSIVSDADLWMFISSNGGLTAGRKNAEQALFPYYTDDKITEFADTTGSKSIFRIKTTNDEVFIWEPFSNRNSSNLHFARNLYKSVLGNQIIFEEILIDLGISFNYKWSSSNGLGFVKTSSIKNQSNDNYTIDILDGLQNILPFGVNSELQSNSSNLVDAYKRTELHPDTGLGIFALNAMITDKAEPSEALKANIVWSTGLASVSYLLSSLQLDNFRKGLPLSPEFDIKGEKGGYFIFKNQVNLSSDTELSWHTLADVNKSYSQIMGVIHLIGNHSNLNKFICDETNASSQNLLKLVSSSDGFQKTKDKLQDSRHYSNVLFNIMRGGIFDLNYQVEKTDFVQYLTKANVGIAQKYHAFLDSLTDFFTYPSLIAKSKEIKDLDFIRLSVEYLPLKFSRRHGDPSRPWNKFSINIQYESGQKILDYQGNWRDIFQNWETLSYSYPYFLEGMLFKFLNASTFDGYNPYRLTKDGFDWETIEKEDPWSYIGYWGDHQIIYLLKFLEALEKCKPGELNSYFDQEYFVYAAVPYRIKSYIDITKNGKDTIDFDHQWNDQIRKNIQEMGADGALLQDHSSQIYRVNLIEKLLATLLGKLSNFIPEGGIWMNTQRPEWNDANNALVGNGVSMVTLYYMRRFLVFLEGILAKSDIEQIKISGELVEFYHTIRQTLQDFTPLLTTSISDRQRKDILDKLGYAASDYRELIYKSGFWGKKRTISVDGLLKFVNNAILHIEHSIRANQRKDKLFHAYNLMTYTDDGVKISHLDEMLEGQVAILSAGYLNPIQALELLDALKKSALFRHDQYSYILYPNKNLAGFLQKNIVPKEKMESMPFIMKMLSDQHYDLIEKDLAGQYHFNSKFKNAKDVSSTLDRLSQFGEINITHSEKDNLLQIFESVFNHKAFTGRSGTFYGYEGLGSIYWHMVSKLLLAVQETIELTNSANHDAEIMGRQIEHYFEIRAGLGVDKSPSLYGAFPTDPYSHTPMHKGAQQPGMTGQVKEDILARFGELGIKIVEGELQFRPFLLRGSEFLNEDLLNISYFDVNGQKQEINLLRDQLFFTFCQVPIIYEKSNKTSITIQTKDHNEIEIPSGNLGLMWSKSVFGRHDEISFIKVNIDANYILKN